MSVRQLRKIAELNFCESCYRKYMALIEPTIKIFVTEPLRDWGAIEHDVTQMVRKIRGVFKDTDTILISIDDEEQLPDFLSGKVDVEAFRRIGRWGFERKIKYLHKYGILQEHSYKLLDELRQTRNRLHDYEYKFTKQELDLFSQARGIVSLMNMAVVHISKKDTVERFMVSAEKSAEKLLQMIQYGDSKERNTL